MEKDCFNCKYYVFFEAGAGLIEICCKHKIRIMAEPRLCCRGWEPDNLHVDYAMERMQQKDAADLLHKE